MDKRAANTALVMVMLLLFMIFASSAAKLADILENRPAPVEVMFTLDK